MPSVPDEVKRSLKGKQQMHNSNLDLRIKSDRRMGQDDTRSNITARSIVSRAKSCASKMSSPALLQKSNVNREIDPEIHIDKDTLELVNRYFREDKVLSPSKSVQTQTKRERKEFDETE